MAATSEVTLTSSYVQIVPAATDYGLQVTEGGAEIILKATAPTGTEKGFRLQVFDRLTAAETGQGVVYAKIYGTSGKIVVSQ